MMSLILKDFGKAGWMETATEASKHIDSLRAKARSVIAGHRFEIQKLANYPGVMAPNTKAIEEAKQKPEYLDAYTRGY